jgi:hypothetical protein
VRSLVRIPTIFEGGEIRHAGSPVKVRNSGLDRGGVRNSAGLEELDQCMGSEQGFGTSG